jgi:hypothetical protein
MWEMVSMMAGLVVLLFLFQLLDLPEQIGRWLKHRVPREDLERKVLDLESRVTQLEQQQKNTQS